MKFNILNIDLNKTKRIGSLGETDVIAYWVKFCNEALNSETFLLPYSNDVKRLDNNTISVETSQSAIRNLRRIYDELLFEPRIKRLEDDKYRIVGKINFVLREDYEDEESAVVLVDVDVSGITFSIEQSETDISNLNLSEWVEFESEGLLLFDEGY
jgi:hypothetical protein